VHLLARCTQVRLENRTENAHTDTQPPARLARCSVSLRTIAPQQRCCQAPRPDVAQSRTESAQHGNNSADYPPCPHPYRFQTHTPIYRCACAVVVARMLPESRYSSTSKQQRERERERESNLVNRRTDGRTRCNSRSADSLCSRRLPVYTSKAACRRSISAARRQAGRQTSG